jgi:hypothetical protein
MLKKLLGLSTLLCVSFVSGANSSADRPSEHYLPTLGSSIEYTLPPQEPQVFTNVFYWVIKASCTITSHSESNALLVKFLKKTGEVNEQRLNAGDQIEIVLNNKEDIKIVSNPGSQVELTNMGDSTINAVCIAK